MYRSVSQSKRLQLNSPPFACLFLLLVFLLPSVVSLFCPAAHSLLCFLSWFPSSFLLCFLFSPQLRPWEGWTQMTDKDGSEYKMEGQLLEACKDLSVSGRRLAA